MTAKLKILLISDIHGNYPALKSVANKFHPQQFDHIINCGDSLVYCPFSNETLQWLQQHHVISILGNTDKKIIKLLKGKSFKKPSRPDKRVMYMNCAEQLSSGNRDYLLSLPVRERLVLPWQNGTGNKQASMLGVFHGSPAKHHEFLFNTTDLSRFDTLAQQYPYRIIVTGHSHTPYHLKARDTDFINPGSVGRMFDDNPAASCAILELTADNIHVHHMRVEYDIQTVVNRLKKFNLPPIYEEMYKTGKKLN